MPKKKQSKSSREQTEKDSPKIVDLPTYSKDVCNSKNCYVDSSVIFYGIGLCDTHFKIAIERHIENKDWKINLKEL